MILLRDNSARAKNILIAFYILTAIQLLSIVSSLMQLNLLHRIATNNFDIAEAESNDLRHSIVMFSYFAMYLICIILFIMWFRRAYFNLNLTGRAYTKYEEGWAAGAWFVPFLNLVRPYQIMDEIWHKTQDVTDNLLVRKSSTILGWWWALWIASNIAANIANRMSSGAAIADIIEYAYVNLFADLIELISLVLIIIIVKKVSVMEQNLQLSAVTEINPDDESGDKLKFVI